jgi:hypothetical protein
MNVKTLADFRRAACRQGAPTALCCFCSSVIPSAQTGLGCIMKRAGLFISAIAGALLSSSTFAAGPFGTIHVGDWKGGAYTDDTTGAFSHCGAAGHYLNGFNLAISQHPDRTWLILFESPTWNLPEGQSVPVELTFDGQSHFQIFGTATRGKIIRAILPDPAVNALRKSHLR